MFSIRHFSIFCFVLLACLSHSDGLTHSSLSHPPPFVPADLAKAEALNPGDQVPSFSVPTINNGGTFNYHAMPANASAFKQVNPVLIHAWNTQSAFYNAMWTYNEYIDDLLLRSPNATQYLFLSWSDSLYLEEAHYMQSRIQERMNSLNFTSSRKQQFNQRIYYGAVPVSKLTGPASFIPSLLTNWTDVLNQFFIYNSSQNAAERLSHRPSAFSSNQEKSWISEPFAKASSTPARRLDGRWPWVMSMTSVFGNSSIPIAWFGDGCGNSSMPSSLGQQYPLPIQNVTGKLALILRAHADENGKCSFFQKIHNAQKSGAVGAVIVSDEGEPLIDVNCNGDNCDVLMEIPATMITWTAGQNIYQLLTTSKPQLMFQDTTSAGFHFGLDAESRVQELGWFQYPSMAFIAWEAQWFEYYERLLKKIETVQAPDSSLTIPIYQQVVMSGPAYVNVTIPQAGTEGLGQWAGAYLDLQLGCPGPKDSSCPAWDRILGLFVCCNYTSGESFTNSSATCGQEIGRWITPFGRRVGRWLTEITPFLPLLSNNGTLMPSGPKEMQCTFQINCGTTENWVPTVNLILSSEANPNDYLQKLEDPRAPLPKKAANKLIPFQIVPLYEGGTFDQTYNNRTPIVFTPSAGTVKVELVSVITGHGSDNHNCAEFCITSHHFEFNNDTTFSRTFHNAGDELGCADKVPDGVLPNEYGTWLYGRDGWCDGQEVKPWVVDVTNVISLTKANTVLYWGYYDGHTPDPTENPGYIDLHSYLVYYKSG